MSALAEVLAGLGIKVTYCADLVTLPERKKLGWVVPTFKRAYLQSIRSREMAIDICRSADPDVVHLCEGLRGNGYVSDVQSELQRLRRSFWVMMEAVDERGLKGLPKKAIYKILFARKARSIAGVLAIGETTPGWVSCRAGSLKVVPFAYFPDRHEKGQTSQSAAVYAVETGSVNLIYVGQLIKRKNVRLLLKAMTLVPDSLHLTVIGSGIETDTLRGFADTYLPGRVHWLGTRKQSDIPQIIAQADALVLPSLHDGWGAVVSEALSVGTPALCSDHCGAAILCRTAPGCGVFASSDKLELARYLEEIRVRGTWSPDHRTALKRWAEKISPESGADYLLRILMANVLDVAFPTPPWQRGD